MHSFFTRHKRTFFALTAAFLYSATIALATPPTTPYTPGETLNPTCTPGSANCTVSIFPDQSTHSGEYLTTNGSVTSWATIPASTNIYNSDGTLTGNRTLTLSGNTLDIIGITTTRFSANGNVGIGDTTPLALFTVGNGDLFQVSSAGKISAVFDNAIIDTDKFLVSDGGSIKYRTGSELLSDLGVSSTAYVQDGNSFGALATIGTNDSNDLAFETNGTERAKINTSGNLLFYGSIKIGNSSSPHSSAALDISSTSKGVLFPRMTSAERTTISTPATGLHVYQTDTTEGSYVNLSGGWQRFLTTADIGTTITSDNIYNSDGTLTGNRTISTGSYTLKIRTNDGDNQGIKFHRQTLSGLPVYYAISGVDVSDGSTTNYGLAFSNNGNGAILNGGQVLQFQVGGVTQGMFAFSTGNFLLNTTTDSGYKLDVNGNTRISGTLTISGTVISNSYNAGTIGLSNNGEGNIRLSFPNNELQLFANTKITTSTGTNNVPSAIFQIDSTTQGFLQPRMTAAQRTAISTPATGLQLYQTDTTEGSYVNLSGGWQRFLTTADTPTNLYTADGTLAGNRTINSGGFTLSIQPNTVVGGVSHVTQTTNGLPLTYSLQSQGNFILINPAAANKFNQLTSDPENFWQARVDGAYGLETILSARANVGGYNGVSGSSLTVATHRSLESYEGLYALGRIGTKSFIGLDGTTDRYLRFWEPGVAKRAVIGHTDNADGGHLVFRTGDATTLSDGTQAMRIFQATQNVMIGTSTTDAGYKLDVNGAARATSSLTSPIISTESIQSTTGPTLYLGTWGQANLSFTNGLASFSHNGTAPPWYGKLNIYSGNNSYAALHINSADGQIGYGNNIVFSNGAAIAGSIYNSNYSLYDMGIGNRDGYYIHLFPGGNVSLGNGTPTDAGYKLDVNGSLHATGLVRFDGGGFRLNRTSGEPYIVYEYNAGQVAQIRAKSDGTLRFTDGAGGSSYWEMTPTQQLNQGGVNFGSARISISNGVNNPTIWARGSAGFTNNAPTKNMVYEGMLGTGYNMADGFGTYNIYQAGSVDEGTFSSAYVGVKRNGGNSNWDYFIQSNSGGSITDKLIVRHTGQLVLPKYGINTFTGTSAYTLGVDASGNVVEVANASSDSFTAARAFTLNGYTLDIVGTTTSRFFANGNVGIGTTTDAGYKLDVNGTVAMSALTAATSSQDALCIVNGGTEVQRNTGAQTCTVSSARFKHDIQPLSGDILSVLTRFIPSTFIYNDQSNNRIGLIAEEVATIDPRLVFYEADGVTPRGVRYEDLSVMTLKGLQDVVFTINNVSDLTKTNTLRDSLLSWLGDFGNGIGKIFAGTLQAKDQVCIDDVCINKEQLRTLIQNQTEPAPSAPTVSQPETILEADVAPQEVLEESPVISIPETVDTSSDTIQEPI